MPKISISSDKTQSLMLKYQSLVINPIVGAKISIASDKTQLLVRRYKSLVIKLSR